MSNSKMLIDATHPEETRVVVQRNGRVEEFDFESAARKLLRGNIYLAKVTRVEPSLQAAFVDYGGNRHGFLAFNEIHPDYYQIPVADRQALIDEEAAAEAELEAAADRRAEALEKRARGRGQVTGAGRSEHSRGAASDTTSDADEAEAPSEGEISNIVDVEEDEHIEEIGGEDNDDEAPTTFAAASVRDDAISEPAPERTRFAVEAGPEDGSGEVHAETGEALPEAANDEDGPDGSADEPEQAGANSSTGHHNYDNHNGDDDHDHDHDHEGTPTHASTAPHGETADTGNGGDLLEEVPVRQRRRPRSYKIQEVIKRRQVILVQVVKEERGNKGAALTTYLSLAGRYTVLMPNTARGGGISRKITNPQDRKRLKAIAQELDVPEGMGLIIRTAGAARTKQEIKRDFEYLLRLWESVRDLTLQSTAPSLVYEEGDLIKRSIRDLYNKDVEEVVVAGDGGYREAADFMRMLLPSHSKNVIPYNEPTPLFARYGVERQLNAMFSPQVTLRSGGYIVINQTEALVAIDVNSGKSTREFSIEETALATNLEAADEIARQLKLRDLAGLIVIDFIDMEEKRNNRAVERRLKDALRHDRARIQLGRISHFGLMEMSRQRLRTGVLEGSTSQCQHCQGTGIIRSTESVALAVLRGLEDAITAGAQAPLIATTTSAVALYILNSKRAYVADMEARHGYAVTILGSDRIHGANFTIERGAAAALPIRRPERAAVNMDWGFEGEEDEEAPPSFEGNVIEDAGSPDDEDNDRGGRERAHHGREGGREGGGREGGREAGRDSGEDDGGKRGRRRRRRRGGRRGERGEEGGPRQSFGPADSAGDQDMDAADGEGAAGDDDADDIIETGAGSDVDGIEAPRTADNGEGDDNDQRRRRRRRGRRGGRRGRGERPGVSADGSVSTGGPEGDAAGDDESGDDDAPDGDGMTAADHAPGFEPQPEINLELSGDVPVATGRRERGRHDRGDRNDRNDRNDRDRRRPERLWDVKPSAEPSSGETADQPAIASEVSNESPRAHSEPAKPAGSPRQDVSDTTQTTSAGEERQTREPPTRRHETGSSEPRIERVVVTPGQNADEPAEAAPAPQRKGWWQRKFGGE